MRKQRGFTLLELVVTVAILSMVLLATAATFGMRVPRVHPAELALQAALIDARALAASTGNITNPVVPTGATVTIDVDPRDKTGFGSVIKVYRSRPITYSGPGVALSGGAPVPLNQDTGFPTARVGATFHLIDSNPLYIKNDIRNDRPFTILISNSGYASIIRDYVYDPTKNNYISDGDPGCTEGGVAIQADDGPVQESAPFSCRDAVLQMKVPTYGS